MTELATALVSLLRAQRLDDITPDHMRQLCAMTNANSLPADCIATSIALLATRRSDADRADRQRAFLLLTAHCFRPPATTYRQAVIDALVTLLDETRFAQHAFVDEEALLRILINVASASAETTCDLDALLRAVCACSIAPHSSTVPVRFIDTCVKVGMVSSSVMGDVVRALCLAVVSTTSHQPWQCIRALLSSQHRSHCADALIAQLAPDLYDDDVMRLTCGSIFFAGMACWGSQRVDTGLNGMPFTDVLDAFLVLLASPSRRRHEPIVHEVALSLRRLVKKFGDGLEVEWAQIIDLLDASHPFVQDAQGSPLAIVLRETFDAMRAFRAAAVPAFYDLLVRCKGVLSDECLEDLAQYMQARVHPSDPAWLVLLSQFMRLFFADRAVPDALRLSALAFAGELARRYQSVFASDIIAAAFLPFVAGVIAGGREADDADDTRVRLAAIEAIAETATAIPSDHFLDLLDLLRAATASSCASICLETPRLLERVFRAALLDPRSENCIKAHAALVDLIAHDLPALREHAICVLGGLGAAPGGRIRLGNITSPYMFARAEQADVRTSAVVPMGPLWRALLNVLQNETDESVFVAALGAIARLLAGFATSPGSLDVGLLCSLISARLRAGSFGSQLVNAGAKSHGSAGFSLLVQLLAARKSLDTFQRKELISCLVAGLDQAPGAPDQWLIAQTCLRGLTLCALDSHELLSARFSRILSLFTSSAPVMHKQSRVGVLEFLHCFASVLSEGPNADYDDQADRARLFLSSDHLARVFAVLLCCVSLTDQPLDTAESRLAFRCIALWYFRCDQRQRVDNYRVITAALQPLLPTCTEAVCLLDLVHRFAHCSMGAAGTTAAITTPIDLLPDRYRAASHSQSWATPTAVVTITSAPSGYSQVLIRRASSANIAWTMQFCSPLRLALLSIGVADRHHTDPSGGDDVDNAVCCELDGADFDMAAALSAGPSQTIDPAFIMMQYDTFGSGGAVPLKSGGALTRSLAVLDQTPCQETMKFGVVYVAPEQSRQDEILNNCTGSCAYQLMLRDLGTRVRLRGAAGYTAGLDRANDDDGRLALVWMDSFTRICFHVATMIPNRPIELPRAEHKKRHIGNDFVNIVYTDAERPYDPETLSGQLNFVQIVVRPIGGDLFRIELNVKPNVPAFGFLHECNTFPQEILGATVRQLAILAQLACWSAVPSGKSRADYLSTWQDRLQQIQRIGERLS